MSTQSILSLLLDDLLLLLLLGLSLGKGGLLLMHTRP
jgi:hypothetical protein